MKSRIGNVEKKRWISNENVSTNLEQKVDLVSLKKRWGLNEK